MSVQFENHKQTASQTDESLNALSKTQPKTKPKIQSRFRPAIQPRIKNSASNDDSNNNKSIAEIKSVGKFSIGSNSDSKETEADFNANRITGLRSDKKSDPPLNVNEEVLESLLAETIGHGDSLDANLKSEMEKELEADFSGVKIHTDGTASEMASMLNAKAFAVGKDIYFNGGEFDPSSKSGKWLLLHELTHVKQAMLESDKNTIRRKINYGEVTDDGLTRLVSNATSLEGFAQDGIQFANYIGNEFAEEKFKSVIVYTQRGLDIYSFPDLTHIKHVAQKNKPEDNVWIVTSDAGVGLVGYRNNEMVLDNPAWEYDGFDEDTKKKVAERGFTQDENGVKTYKLNFFEDFTFSSASELKSLGIFPAVMISGDLPVTKADDDGFYIGEDGSMNFPDFNVMEDSGTGTGTGSGQKMEEWADKQVGDLMKKMGLGGDGKKSDAPKSDKPSSDNTNPKPSTTPLSQKDTKARERKPFRLVPWPREDGKQFVNVWVGGKDAKHGGEVVSVELKEGETLEELEKRIGDATEKAQEKLEQKALKEEEKMTGGQLAIDESTYMGGDQKNGKVANRPSYRASMDGPVTLTKNATGSYRMKLHYEDMDSSPVGMMLAAYQGADYTWQVIEITSLYQKVMKEKAAAVRNKDASKESHKELDALKQSSLGAEGMDTITQQDADWREMERRYGNLAEDASQAYHDLANPNASEGTDGIGNILINEFNLATLPLHGIMSLGGQLINTITSFFCPDPAYESEIPFPDEEGIYMVRCVAQPIPSEKIRRMPSIAVKAVTIKEITKHTTEELDAHNVNLEAEILSLLISFRNAADGDIPKLQLQLELKLQEAAQSNKSFIKTLIQERQDLVKDPTLDPLKLPRISMEIGILEASVDGDDGTISDILGKQLAVKNKELAEAKGDDRKIRQINKQIEAITKRKKTADAREKDMKAFGKIVRPEAVFVNEADGSTIPLLIEFGKVGSGRGGDTMRLSDITGSDSDQHDATSLFQKDAIISTIKKYAGHFPYGRGYLVVRFPKDGENYGITEPIMVRCNPRDSAQASERLDELLQVLAIVGLFIPGVGLAVAAVGAAVSAAHIIHRIQNETFAWDSNTLMDVLNIVGAAASGVSKLTGAKFVKSSKVFAVVDEGEDINKWGERLAKLGKAADFVDNTVNHVSYMLGSMEIIEGFLDVQEQLYSGKMTHAEARRAKLNLMSQAMNEGIMQHAAGIVGHYTGNGTHIKPKDTAVKPHDTTKPHDTDTHTTKKPHDSGDSQKPKENDSDTSVKSPVPVGGGGTTPHKDSGAEIVYPKDATPEQKVDIHLSNAKKLQALTDKNNSAALKELLNLHGNWRNLMIHLESHITSDVHKFLMEDLMRYRNSVADHMTMEFGLTFSGKRSDEPMSDIDMATTGKDAGKKMMDAEAYMKKQFGDNWSELLRMNFYTEAGRLSMYEKVKSSMSTDDFGKYQKEITGKAEVLTFAKMLQHAGDNAESIARVEKLMAHLGDAEKTQARALAAEKPEVAKAAVKELHTTIDTLHGMFEAAASSGNAQKIDPKTLPANIPSHLKDAIANAKTPEEMKLALAKAITELQMEANFRTEEAYISPGAGRQVVGEVAVAGHEAYQSAIANLEMIEHIIKLAGGDVRKAATEYEMHKYIHRFITSSILAGQPTNSLVLMYYQASFDISKNSRMELQGISKRDLDFIMTMHNRFMDEVTSMLPAMKANAELNPSAWNEKPKSLTSTDEDFASGIIPDNEKIIQPTRRLSPEERKRQRRSAKEQDARLREGKVKSPVDQEKSAKVDDIQKDIEQLPEHTVIVDPEPASKKNAYEIFKNCMKDDAQREAGIFYNASLDMYIVVQGGPNDVQVGNDQLPSSTKVQRWQEIIDNPDKHTGIWKLVAHSHPQDSRGYVTFANRVPSGGGADFGTLVKQSWRDNYKPQMFEIHFVTNLGPQVTYFSYDPGNPKPLMIEYPHTRTGMPQQKRFATMEEYHQWIKTEFNVDMGPVPDDMKTLYFPVPSDGVPVALGADQDTAPITKREGPKDKNKENTDTKDPIPKATDPSKRTGPYGSENEYGIHHYKWPGDDKAMVKFEVNGKEIKVDHVVRGSQPKGSAGKMLAEALRAAGQHPNTLFAPNVLQKTPGSNDLIEKVLKDAVKELGGTVAEVTKGEALGKQWIRVTIKY